jgi:putative ABC transport system substrate-binding protein
VLKQSRVRRSSCEVFALAFLVLACGRNEQAPVSSKSSPPKRVVAIIEPMQHIAVSDISRGIRDALGKRADIQVETKNANGDAIAMTQIISAYKGGNASVVIPIFTSTAQIAKDAIRDSPVVFAAVTDPVAAGIVASKDHPGGNVTGVSDLWPIGAQFDLIHEILPRATRIGIVYDPTDPSSSATMPLIDAEASKRGMTVVKRPIHNVPELTDALASLRGSADLLFTANDVTVTKGFPALVSFAAQYRIPLFAGDYSSVERGAIGAVGQNYYTVGKNAGELALKILGGARPADTPVVYTTGGDLYLNAEAARRMGVPIPPGVKSRALKVYETISTGEETSK